MATSNCLETVNFLINISRRMALGGYQILDGAQIVLNCDFYYFFRVYGQFSGQFESRPRLWDLVYTSYSTLCELIFRYRKRKTGNTKPKTATGLVQDPQNSDLTCWSAKILSQVDRICSYRKWLCNVIIPFLFPRRSQF